MIVGPEVVPQYLLVVDKDLEVARNRYAGNRWSNHLLLLEESAVVRCAVYHFGFGRLAMRVMITLGYDFHGK
jgi:hypothetical protein